MVCAALVSGLALWACRGDRSGGAALRAAREKSVGARYLVVSEGGGRQTLFSPRLTVIRRHGRVISWATAAEEFGLRKGERCYVRSTDFNRDDLRQLREGAWPARFPDPDVEMRDGGRVLVGRERHTDFADTEFEVFLDDAGRATSARHRSAKFGVIPPGRWQTLGYRYPSAAQFARLAGGRPRPRCS